ncbi:MAG: RNA methyltransferase, partial [Caldiserica bacterium]|nr:RNA methyltransferase [Caldisericota bacterium]
KDAHEISFKKVAELLKEDLSVLILLGTGWGIAYRELGNVDYFLPPIEGIGDFNHLSVRSAASIVLDRIISQFKEL